MFTHFRRTKFDPKPRTPSHWLLRPRLELLEDRSLPSLYIANADFSQPNAANYTTPPYPYIIPTVQDWVQTGESYTIAWGLYTPYNNQPSGTYFTTIPNGSTEQIAQVTSGNIYQILTSTLESNTTYTLSVDVGKRNDSPFPGYSVQLLSFNGSTFTLLSSESSVNPPSGTFVRSTQTYSSGVNNPHQGENLVVRLSGFPHTSFDNVALDTASDIVMQSAQLQAGNVVQYTYSTTGNPGQFDVGLYRSTDGITYNPADLIDTQSITPSPTNPQTPGTFTLPSPWVPDPSLPYLMVVADPLNAIAESDEDNNSAAFLIPNLTISSTQFTATSVNFSYLITGNPTAFTVGLYRSSDHLYDPADQLIVSQVVAPNSGSGVFSLPGATTGDPTKPYLLVVADPWNATGQSGSVFETNEFEWDNSEVAKPAGPPHLNVFVLRGMG